MKFTTVLINTAHAPNCFSEFMGDASVQPTQVSLAKSAADLIEYYEGATDKTAHNRAMLRGLRRDRKRLRKIAI